MPHQRVKEKITHVREERIQTREHNYIVFLVNHTLTITYSWSKRKFIHLYTEGVITDSVPYSLWVVVFYIIRIFWENVATLGEYDDFYKNWTEEDTPFTYSNHPVRTWLIYFGLKYDTRIWWTSRRTYVHTLTSWGGGFGTFCQEGMWFPFLCLLKFQSRTQ